MIMIIIMIIIMIVIMIMIMIIIMIIKMVSNLFYYPKLYMKTLIILRYHFLRYHSILFASPYALISSHLS
jgi:hypothetical protein